MTITREAVRIEDMSSRGRLRLLQQTDGDVIVAVQSEQNGLLQPGDSVEFCTIGAGGGRSPRTLVALRALMDAIDADNAYHPIPPNGNSSDLAPRDETYLFEHWASDPVRAEKIPLAKHPNGAYSDTRSYLIAYGWKSRAKQYAALFERPEGIDPFANGDGDATAASYERLRLACCIQQPFPVPDQMALVWRADIMRMRHDLIHKQSFFDLYDWIAVAERLPEQRAKPRQLLTRAVKTYPEGSNYPGEGIKGVNQDWVVRKYPQNFTHWTELPYIDDSTPKGGAA